MSALLKSGVGHEVRRFIDASPPATATRQASPAPDPRAIELARLSAEVERLKRAREEEAEASDRAVAAAREEGRTQGLAEAQTREADRLATLSKALAESAASFQARLEGLDALAPALARAALGKLFVDIEDWAAPVEAMLARQLGELRRAAVVAVRVSPHDFPDAQAVAGLSNTLGIEGVRVEVDRELRAGASRIECRLGQIDLDLRAQSQALAALLEEMAG